MCQEYRPIFVCLFIRMIISTNEIKATRNESSYEQKVNVRQRTRFANIFVGLEEKEE